MKFRIEKDIKVITNGYDHQDFISAIERTKFFNIAYFGSMNKDRNPTILWETLSEMKKSNHDLYNKISIDLFGDVDGEINEDIKKLGISEIVSKYDFIPHKEAITKMRQARVLLLMINNTQNSEGVIPGKVFEYIASKRPIICIGPEKGDTRNLLEPIEHAYYIAYNEFEKIGPSLASAFEMKNDCFDADVYSRKNLAKKYSLLISQLVTTSE